VGSVAPLLADVGSPIIGLLSGLVVAGFGLAGVLYRGRKVEIPTVEATVVKAKADAALSNAEAAGKWIETQQKFIDGVTKQLEEAQRQATLAQAAASGAKLAAEEAKQQLAESQTRAAEREHALVNERLKGLARISELERDKDNLSQQIQVLRDEVASLRVRLGQFERRSS
jgi:chromosome segregation ATPase